MCCPKYLRDEFQKFSLFLLLIWEGNSFLKVVIFFLLNITKLKRVSVNSFRILFHAELGTENKVENFCLMNYHNTCNEPTVTLSRETDFFDKTNIQEIFVHTLLRAVGPHHVQNQTLKQYFSSILYKVLFRPDLFYKLSKFCDIKYTFSCTKLLEENLVFRCNVKESE